MSLAALLAGLGDWLRTVDPADYARTTPRTWGTLGQHLRHSLDHVQALVDGVAEGTASYDRRVRGTAMEADIDAGIARLEALAEDVAALAEQDPEQALQVELVIDPGEPAQVYPSTLVRELAFVLSHAVHHNALMGAIAAEWGHGMPPALAMAPATRAHAHVDSPPCAR